MANGTHGTSARFRTRMSVDLLERYSRIRLCCNVFRVWSGGRESNPHCQLGNGNYACVSARRTGSGVSLADRGCPSWIVHSSFADAKVSRERGGLGAGGSPAFLEGEQSRSRYPVRHGPCAGSSPVTVSELGAWGPCARWLRGLTPPLVPSCM